MSVLCGAGVSDMAHYFNSPIDLLPATFVRKSSRPEWGRRDGRVVNHFLTSTCRPSVPTNYLMALTQSLEVATAIRWRIIIIHIVYTSWPVRNLNQTKKENRQKVEEPAAYVRPVTHSNSPLLFFRDAPSSFFFHSLALSFSFLVAHVSPAGAGARPCCFPVRHILGVNKKIKFRRARALPTSRKKKAAGLVFYFLFTFF